MKRLHKMLLAATITAGLPALAMAQRGPDQRDHGDHGDHGRPSGVGRGGDRGPGPQDRRAPPQAAQAQAPQPPQAPQVQAQARPQQYRGAPSAPAAPIRTQEYRGAPDARGFAGGRPGWQDHDNDRHDNDRRDQGARGYGRPDDHRGYDQRGYAGRVEVYRGGDRYDRGWRNDRRYDWRDYRSSHREAFRMPRYQAPRGWAYGYRRFGIGVRIPAFFYGQSYWIDDPYDYRLPPAYGPYRWIRYYNDAVLIDLRSGLIVDEIPDFFW